MKRRGFLLILSLLLCVFLLLCGMAFMGKRAAQYRGAFAMQKGIRARALAEAGLEDARVKLDKDVSFPPPGDRDQTLFTYSETVRDSAGQVVGSYTVTVDSRWKVPQNPPDPNSPSVILVTSVGNLGGDPARPEATYALRMEIDCDDDYELPPRAQFQTTDWVEVTDFTPPR